MAEKSKIKHRARIRRKMHIKKVVRGSKERPRLVVYRSLKHTYAQIINDDEMNTIVACNTNASQISEKIKQAKSKLDAARIMGETLAELAKEKGVEEVVFDRNGYMYHGRVKAVADGARKAGLKF